MTAIILTAQQAADLEAANAAANSNRALKPRLLQDGRLILNADILDDGYFADPSRPWAAILGISVPQEIPADQSADSAVPTAVPDNSVASPQSSSLSVVELTQADLTEPQL